MTSTTVEASPSARIQRRTQQNWVIDRRSDGLFIIAAPLISLVWALAFVLWFGPAVVLTIFAVFNVAHHLPTFIRIYGDRDLMRRFRWSLLLGPVLPFSLAMCVAAYVVLGGYDMTNVLYLMIILQLWDPWHFLMQHYGFMRIYDRNNQVRRAVASRMDLMICSTWFIFIMVATLDWLPNLLYESYRFHGFPILFLLDGGVYQVVQALCLVAALAATVAYLGYLAFCRAQSHFVSRAKVMLVIITFGVMYLTYVPNSLITALVPDWNFALGFAVLGMVHVTQYLAIVWKYNRGLSRREGAARSGIFQELFSRGGWNVASAFVLACLLYGFILTFLQSNRFNIESGGDGLHMGARWFMGVIFAVGFTSTLTHYYFDGFIWKVRHKENQENLGILRTESRAPAHSWWEGVSRSTAREAFLRQCLYFVPAILLSSVTFWVLAGDSVRRAPLGHALEASTPGAAQAAISAMEAQLEVETAMIRIRPRAKHYTYRADLLYIIGTARVWLAGQLGTTDERLREEKRRSLAEAIGSMERALELGPPYSHVENRKMSRKEVEERLVEWRLELQQI